MNCRKTNRNSYQPHEIVSLPSGPSSIFTTVLPHQAQFELPVICVKYLWPSFSFQIIIIIVERLLD